MRVTRKAKVTAVRQTRNHAAHPLIFSYSANTRPLQMEARQGPQGASNHNRAGEKEDKTNKQEGITNNQIRQEGNTVRKARTAATAILDESERWEMKENSWNYQTYSSPHRDQT
ncbi:hypothetical protein DPMN_165372 [Dreissena polymorpha]|uniref:Uncharacterized protein n=1 Tax=Dreissena polymorpha TaxID=45954 RepID=A0A9D4IWI7_DREPO|nr:hypothetical protein DPMN_165372 [Dreissena polymorpha]